MRKMKLIGLRPLFALGLTLLASLPAAPLYRVIRVEGRVIWITADRKERRPALPGTALAAGDLLVALEGGACVFGRENGSGSWRLGSGSAARMDETAIPAGPACIAGTLLPAAPLLEGDESAKAKDRLGSLP